MLLAIISRTPNETQNFGCLLCLLLIEAFSNGENQWAKRFDIEEIQNLNSFLATSDLFHFS